MRCLIVATLVLGLAASAGAESLRVLALDSEPFFYQKEGRLAGIEYDILEYFAKSRELTLEVELVDSFPDLLEGIEAGAADLSAGTITITPERAERFAFSAPYFPVQVTLVERVERTTKSLQDLKGMKVAAFAQTTAEEALQAVPGIVIVNPGPLREQMEAILRGELRALAADSSAVIPLLEEFPSLKIGMSLGEPQGFGFALPLGSPLAKPLSEHIGKLKESGIYFRILTAHMGPRASEIIRASKTE